MSLARGSSMTASSKGSKLRTAANRARMPWTRAKEIVPVAVLSRKDAAILDGVALVEGIQRQAQLEPLAAIKAIAAQRDYHTSTGLNLFQLAAHMRHEGRGQRFWRKDWKEGTYDKHVTLASVSFDRQGFTGEALGYVTFHGETTLVPMAIDNADVPGWECVFDSAAAVPADRIVAAPPSEGTEVPVDPRRYKLRAYPGYDAPNPAEFVERRLREQGVIPDAPVDEVEAGRDEGADDGSVKHS